MVPNATRTRDHRRHLVIAADVGDDGNRAPARRHNLAHGGRGRAGIDIIDRYRRALSSQVRATTHPSRPR